MTETQQPKFSVIFSNSHGARLDTRTADTYAQAAHIAREMIADAVVLMPGDSIVVTEN